MLVVMIAVMQIIALLSKSQTLSSRLSQTVFPSDLTTFLDLI
jgi:hypothetical protein